MARSLGNDDLAPVFSGRGFSLCCSANATCQNNMATVTASTIPSPINAIPKASYAGFLNMAKLPNSFPRELSYLIRYFKKWRWRVASPFALGKKGAGAGDWMLGVSGMTPAPGSGKTLCQVFSRFRQER